MTIQLITRRDALRFGACAGAGLLPLGNALALAAEKKTDKEEVSANEDLMREHGALVRLLLVYQESVNRLKGNPDTQVKALHQAAAIIKKLVEDYHEKVEEKHVFSRFKDANDMGNLVNILYEQHETGRRVTARLLEISAGDLAGEKREEAVRLAEAFMRMYLPHLAREDTVLFPAFRKSMSEKEYVMMGKVFEDMEDQLLGKGGFEKSLSQIEDLEKDLGIYDLTKFTPKA